MPRTEKERITITRIAVAGGTGWAGRRLVSLLRDAGEDVVVLARKTGVDLITGTGLAERLAGVDAVVDVTNIKTQKAALSIEFFDTVTTHLLKAERSAGVSHHVALSVVGCDRVDLGYYMGKRRQEELVLSGSTPGTVLRATQFHEFAAQMLDTRGPIVLAPKMLCQPVALSEVAQQLADLARGNPLGRTAEFAGPHPRLTMDEMVVRLAKTRGDRRLKLRIGMPGRVGRQIKEGGLLPATDGPRGTITFDDWLRQMGDA